MSMQLLIVQNWVSPDTVISSVIAFKKIITELVDYQTQS